MAKRGRTVLLKDEFPTKIGERCRYCTGESIWATYRHTYKDWLFTCSDHLVTAAGEDVARKFGIDVPAIKWC